MSEHTNPSVQSTAELQTETFELPKAHTQDAVVPQTETGSALLMSMHISFAVQSSAPVQATTSTMSSTLVDVVIVVEGNKVEGEVVLMVPIEVQMHAVPWLQTTTGTVVMMSVHNNPGAQSTDVLQVSASLKAQTHEDAAPHTETD